MRRLQLVCEIRGYGCVADEVDEGAGRREPAAKEDVYRGAVEGGGSPGGDRRRRRAAGP